MMSNLEKKLVAPVVKKKQVMTIEREAAERESDPITRWYLIQFMRNRWSMPGQYDIFPHCLSKGFMGLCKQAIISEVHKIIDNLSELPNLKDLFEKQHFE